MTQPFVLSPRYRLDDDSRWLKGVDPSRHYWLWVNGEASKETTLPGLLVSDADQWRQTLGQFHDLRPEEQMELGRLGTAAFTIHCVSRNCYAIATTYQGAHVWHLFDAESIQSLLMTSHPDWQCAPQDVDLGRTALMAALSQSLAA